MVWPTSSKRLREIGSEDFIRNAFSGLKEMQTNAFKPQKLILKSEKSPVFGFLDFHDISF